MLRTTKPVQAEPWSPPAASHRWWFVPPTFILAPVAVSFAAWIVLRVRVAVMGKPASWEGLAGFAEPEEPTMEGLVLLVTWYLAVTMLAYLGWRLASPGPRRAGPALTHSASFERRYFQIVLATAAIGVGYAYYQITSSYSIVESLTSQTANDFSNALSGFAGPQTLRYATILAAPIGIYLWRKKVVGWPYPVAAVLLLLMNAMITSRLGLLMAVCVYLALWVKSSVRPLSPRAGDPRRIVAIVGMGAVLFGALTALNYSRNANYYRDAGVSNPISMNLYQMGAYLAVPAQTSIGVSNAVMHGEWEYAGGPSYSLDAIKPTFLQFDKVRKDEGKDESFYNYSVTFEPSFITNSVFADKYGEYGWWGWFYTILAYGVAGYLFGRLMRFGTIIAGSAGVMVYSFSEVWRTQMLNNGIVMFLLLLTGGAALLATMAERYSARKRVRRSPSA